MTDPIFAPRLMFPPGQWRFIAGMEAVVILLYFLGVIHSRKARYRHLLRLRQERKKLR